MLKKINNFNINNNSLLKLNNILKEVYIIEDEEDYLEYIKNNSSNFKVLGELSNTIINPVIEKDMDLLFFKEEKNLEKIIFLEDGSISISGNVKLKFLCTELLKKDYDCSYLIGIPGTVAAAIVNNTGSGRLRESILDNVIKVEYYKKDKKYIKDINDILYSYRNSEFKFMNNIFISKIYFSFSKINKAELLKKIEKRYSDRNKLEEIYKIPSLGTFYIGNSLLNYYNIITDNISINNNKIINYGEKSRYSDYISLKQRINPLYEIEVEELNKTYKNDYVGVLITDNNNNILLQKRDSRASYNKNKISLFGGSVENHEGIKDALIREIKEELCFNINEIIYNGLFIKNYDHFIQRCFIFNLYVPDIYAFTKELNCKEGDMFVSQINGIDEIIDNDLYTDILKKVLIYNLDIISKGK